MRATLALQGAAGKRVIYEEPCAVHDRGGALPAPDHAELWRERISIPVYRVGEAACYADTSAQSIASDFLTPAILP